VTYAAFTNAGLITRKVCFILQARNLCFKTWKAIFANVRFRSVNAALLTGMWKQKLEAVILLWKRKYFEERNWKRKQTRKHLTSWGAGSGSIFHKTWGTDVEAKSVNLLWKWKRKHFDFDEATNITLAQTNSLSSALFPRPLQLTIIAYTFL